MQKHVSPLNHPLANARGKGAAKSGIGHWWLQRLTAIAMIPLALWFVYSLLSMITHGLSQIGVALWLQVPANALLSLLFMVALFWHAALGLQVVIEDYVSCTCIKFGLLVGTKLGAFFAAVATILAIVKLHFAA
jgi:succinate dehydrogenase / fumarate reductase, membrane anchor subunit